MVDDWVPFLGLINFVSAIVLAVDGYSRKMLWWAWFLWTLIAGPFSVLLYIAVRLDHPLPAMLPAPNAPSVITCPKCSLQMSLPPGYNKSRGKCAHCGAEIAL